MVGAPCTISTYGAIAALKDDTILPAYTEILERRRRVAYDILGNTPGVRMRMSESGILSWLDVGELGSSQEVAGYIAKHAKVLVNQGTPYGEQGENHIRIVTACFKKEQDAVRRFMRIKEALTQLAREKDIV